MKILIGTPVYNMQVTSPFMSSVLALTRVFHEKGIEYLWSSPLGTLVQLARNILASRVLRSDFTHLLFVDADVSFSPETIIRLIDFDKPVTAAVYPHRNFNLKEFYEAARTTDSPTEAFARSLTYPAIFSKPMKVDQGFILSDYAPTGLMLISRIVFEKLREAHPELYAPVTGIVGVDHLLQCFDLMLDQRGLTVGEDVAFCKRWRAIGGEIWTLVEDPIGHTGPYTFKGAAASKMSAPRRSAYMRSTLACLG